MFHALSVELISNELTQSDKWNIVSGKYVHEHDLTTFHIIYASNIKPRPFTKLSRLISRVWAATGSQKS